MATGATQAKAIPDIESRASELVRVDERLAAGDARHLCLQLEAGNILFFAKTPFAISAADREILLGQKQTSAAYHKNVAYRPAEDRVTGLDKSESAEGEQLRAILRNYSQAAAQFLTAQLPPYAGKWRLDYASFRPIEERGRAARLHARNDLCHVDAFPTRPTNGDRILRLFTNINPQQNRIWLTAPPFDVIAKRFSDAIGLPDAKRKDPLSRGLRGIGSALRLPGARRSPYDVFMHRCHNAMKEDAEFQEHAPKERWEFPPESTWMVFTDCVSHAVLEGQYALEQTFMVAREAMVEPQRAPISILERLAGHSLTN
jgi:hypothetical protein